MSFTKTLKDKNRIIDLDGSRRGGQNRSVRRDAMAEAAAVCLEDNGHGSGTPLKVSGSNRGTFTVQWTALPIQAHAEWADLQEATEHGAYFIAIRLVDNLTGLTVVQRSKKGTGFDYWLAPKGTKTLLFQNTSRLEVSGILRGSRAAVRQRARQKLQQALSQIRTGAAYAAVVEFGSPLAHMVKK